jgi:RNA-binding protein 39
LNGFELAGRPIKVGLMDNELGAGGVVQAPMPRSLETGEMERSGVDLGTAGRLALMSKLAEGTGMLQH